jgi:hypothetical protein
VSIRVAVALVATEGLVMIGLGGLQFVRGFGGDIDDRWRAELGAAMALVFGAAACLLARGLVFRRRWARSPTVLVQLLCLPLAVGLLQGGMYGYGVPLLVVPVAVLVLLGVSGTYRPPEPP